MYQICVSGAARGKSVEEGKDMAIAAGKSIATSGNMLMTGATIGLSHYSALGAKEAGGMVVGISPAQTKVEHVKKYRLPTSGYDVIIYSGLHYVGRDSLLIASCDAVISIGGRLGTIHEFAIAMEMDLPIGFLQGAGGVSTEIMDILKAAGRKPDEEVIFDDNPDRLVKRIVAILNEQNKDDMDIYASDYAPGDSYSTKEE